MAYPQRVWNRLSDVLEIDTPDGWVKANFGSVTARECFAGIVVYSC